MKIKKLDAFLMVIIAGLAGTLVYTNWPESGVIEYGERKTAQDLPRELSVDTYLKRNTIKAGEIMEAIVRIPEISIYDTKHKSYGRVMVRYAYPNERLGNPTSYAYDFYYDGSTRFNYENKNISIEQLKDDYHLVKFAVPDIAGPYNVEINDPMQKYEITVVDKMDTKERLLEMLYQYFYTQYNFINQRPLNIEIKEFVVNEKYLEVTHKTSYEACRNIPNTFDAQECTLKFIAGKLFIDPETGIVRRDDSIFVNDPNEIWTRKPYGNIVPRNPK